MLRFVTKADGSREPFRLEKLIMSAERAGLDRRSARRAAESIARAAPEGVTTHRLYELLMDEIEKVSAPSAALLALRHAIADLDSRSFELYAMKALEASGYSCEWDRIIKGRSVEHQVDIVAKKNGETWLVECKRHFNPHRLTGLDVALQVHARLEDLQDGFVAGMNKYSFTGAWIFTNTKFSSHAIRYSNAKNIRMTGWRSGEFGLEKLTEPYRLFPVTVLNIGMSAKSRLLENRAVTLQDILRSKRALAPGWQQIVSQARQVLEAGK